MRINTDAAPWIRKVKAWMRQNGFAGLDRVRVVLRDMYYLGLSHDGSDTVYVRPGLDPIRFCTTVLHEHIHVWLYKRGYRISDFSGEGAASWAEYQFLQQIGTPEALSYADGLRRWHATTNGTDYSEALEHMIRRAG